MLKYQVIHNFFKQQIQRGDYKSGDLLPSENAICRKFSITRTTARKALDELQREEFIERLQGKGSLVKERRKSLGLLNVKGFSEAVGQNVKTIFLQKPDIRNWSDHILFPVSGKERKAPCIHFERLRCVEEYPVMIENNWFADSKLNGFLNMDFVNGSFFKTLSQKYLIEIIGSEQELRAEYADEKTAYLLKIKAGNPVLHISLKFRTSRPDLNIYGELYCNTSKYPIGNSFYL